MIDRPIRQATPAPASPAPAAPADGEAPGTAAPSPDPIVGYIDAIQGRRVFGWAWCRSRPSLSVEVEIRRDDRVLLRVRADALRPDLAKTGLTDGRHGFDVLLDDAVAADESARIAAYGRCGDDEPWAPLVNRAAVQAGKAPAPDGASGTNAPELRQLASALDGLKQELDGRFTRLRKEIGADLARVLAAGRAAPRPEGEDEAQDLRRQLGVVASSMDVLQMRIDAIGAALLEGTAAASTTHRRSDRTLTTVVAALGVVSSAALLLGLLAVFG
jgi:hypothetical protein